MDIFQLLNHNTDQPNKTQQGIVKKMCDYIIEGGVSYGHEIASQAATPEYSVAKADGAL